MTCESVSIHISVKLEGGGGRKFIAVTSQIVPMYMYNRFSLHEEISHQGIVSSIL